jgi:hypothetical protein
MPGNRNSQKTKAAKHQNSSNGSNSNININPIVDLTDVAGDGSVGGNDGTKNRQPSSQSTTLETASAKAFSSKRKRNNTPPDNSAGNNGDDTNISGSKKLQRNFHSSLGRRKPPQRPKLQQQQQQRQSTLSFSSVSKPSSSLSLPSPSSQSHFSHGHVFAQRVVPRDDNYKPKMQKVLKAVFGLESLRPNLQPAAIDCAMRGQSQMIVMATGGGKSLCYQLPACLLGGVTVVISPLLALMKDQTEALNSKGIPASCINSSQTEKENRNILEKIVPTLYPKSLGAKQKKATQQELSTPAAVLLYVTPESIQTERMRAVLKTLYKEDRMALFAVDEAHCLSTWVSEVK